MKRFMDWEQKYEEARFYETGVTERKIIMKTKTIFAITVLLAGSLLVGVARATVIDIHWEYTDGDPAVTGTVQNTLFTSMTADWTNAVVQIDLTQGSLVNPLAPPPPFNDNRNYGTNENDSWTDSPNNLYGYPTNIDGFFDFTTGHFEWFDVGDFGGVTDAIAMRLYATDDAVGTWNVKMLDRDSLGVATEANGTVIGGAFVPEPATICLMVASGVGLLVRRRRIV
jgi:hypothetical protein